MMTQEKGKGMTGYGGIVGFVSNGSGDDARSLIRYTTRGAKLFVITSIVRVCVLVSASSGSQDRVQDINN